MRIKPAAAIIGLAAIIALAGTGTLYRIPPVRAAGEWREVRAPSQARSVWDGVYTKEQAKRGGEIYRGQCAACHGATLNGGEGAPPLAGGEFLSNWNGLSLGDLFERIRVSMPQDHPGRLSREQNADILSYMLSVNKFPAGKKELEHQTELLKEIRFEAIRPDAKQ